MLYRAFAGTLTPREVDELEIWEAAVMLGVGAEDVATERPENLTGRAGLLRRLERARAAGQTKGQLIQVDFGTEQGA